MRVGIVASPFVPVPPVTYGGTELFIATLARYLCKTGNEVIVYTNGESSVDVETRFLYPKTEWPVNSMVYQGLKEIQHTGWSVKDASRSCDVIHLNGPAGVAMSMFTTQPVVSTIHHPHSETFRNHYMLNSSVSYVTLSRFQQLQEEPLKTTVIQHGIDMDSHRLGEGRGGYLCWLGRLSPIKGAHLAIECAKRLGIPLKIGGDVQPVYQKYFDEMVAPEIDGDFIQYVGELDIRGKNALFQNASAMLFPISWDEPFGLVMIEAMACGTPVLALRRGSVEEVVSDGVTGFACDCVDEMVERYQSAANLDRKAIRQYAETHFSAERMARDHIDLYQRLLDAPTAELAMSDKLVAASLYGR
jgi:glycosyltransferase involved in cell wall biosynthesis